MDCAKAKDIADLLGLKAERFLDFSQHPDARNTSTSANSVPPREEILWPLLSASLVRREYPTKHIDCGNQPIVAPLSLMLPPQNSADPLGEEQSAVGAFGMFWKRSMTAWSGTPRLLGERSKDPRPVNFAKQIGIYLLQDDARTIYVGRAADSIYARLKAHTSDRMAGRWNRFSWFGLRRVGADGCLMSGRYVWSDTIVINTLEALLIESVEPPLNRRRGDGLTGLEYLQAFDPVTAKTVPARTHRGTWRDAAAACE